MTVKKLASRFEKLLRLHPKTRLHPRTAQVMVEYFSAHDVREFVDFLDLLPRHIIYRHRSMYLDLVNVGKVILRNRGGAMVESCITKHGPGKLADSPKKEMALMVRLHKKSKTWPVTYA